MKRIASTHRKLDHVELLSPSGTTTSRLAVVTSSYTVVVRETAIDTLRKRNACSIAGQMKVNADPNFKNPLVQKEEIRIYFVMSRKINILE
ncbi:hypothetical protein AVEN_193798-1 [Araneus ventricosus]|uniref:Uncharacterized protein n=1 Tax=Araneus ventricosus TaxID=182803 RepID=A0A4Y2DL98_ARAVE|nr:hypothetical protein AVEN_193798-1 [Araneus ventricosus]